MSFLKERSSKASKNLSKPEAKLASQAWLFRIFLFCMTVVDTRQATLPCLTRCRRVIVRSKSVPWPITGCTSQVVPSRWFSKLRILLYAFQASIKAASTYASWIAFRFQHRYEPDNGDKFRSGAIKSSFTAFSIFFPFVCFYEITKVVRLTELEKF